MQGKPTGLYSPGYFKESCVSQTCVFAGCGLQATHEPRDLHDGSHHLPDEDYESKGETRTQSPEWRERILDSDPGLPSP